MNETSNLKTFSPFSQNHSPSLPSRARASLDARCLRRPSNLPCSLAIANHSTIHRPPARSVKSRGFGVLHGLRHSPSHSRCMILFPSQQSCNATGLTTSWKCGVTMCCKDSKKRWALGCMNSYCRERGITQPRPPITNHMTIPVCSLVRGVAPLTTNKCMISQI